LQVEAMKRPLPRPGFTILELVVVMAVLIILSAITMPSFVGLKGNANQRAAADELRSRVADARGLAMQEGQVYRLAVNRDGTRLRVAPDTPDFAQAAVSKSVTSSSKAIETALDQATIHVTDGDSTNPEAGSSDDWMTIGTFMPNGTCREDWTMVEVYELDYPPIRLQLRGVTGTARVVPADAASPRPGASQ
jgi:prepilin-type N-terminal cleavage/methylation domain-containing protein